MSEKKETKSEMQDETAAGGASIRAESDHLPPEVRGPIGIQLRQVYDRLLAEPLPERFNDLLARLASSSSSESGK